MLTDKTLKVLLKEDIQQYPKMKELYDLLLNTTDEEKKSAALNWLTNETNKNALNAEIQNAIAANIVINTFNIDQAIQELNTEWRNLITYRILKVKLIMLQMKLTT